MHDYQVQQSIEKYDTLADTWNVMYFKLPKPMAKLGAVLCDEPEGILIAGGMTKDFEPMADVYFLKFNTLEFNVFALLGMASMIWAALLLAPRVSGLLKSPRA